MDTTVPIEPYVAGVGFVVVGVLAIVFARPLGRFNEYIANRFFPEPLRDLVMEAPLGLDMRRRNIAGGVSFIIFGLLYLWAVAELT